MAASSRASDLRSRVGRSGRSASLGEPGRVSAQAISARSTSRMPTRSRGRATPWTVRLVQRSRSPICFSVSRTSSRSTVLREKELHCIQPAVDGGHVEQRLVDPPAQQAAAHGRQRAVQHAQQAALEIAAAHGLSELQVAPRRLVQHHELACGVGVQASEQGQRSWAASAAHRRARRRRRAPLRACHAGRSRPACVTPKWRRRVAEAVSGSTCQASTWEMAGWSMLTRLWTLEASGCQSTGINSLKAASGSTPRRCAAPPPGWWRRPAGLRRTRRW